MQINFNFSRYDKISGIYFIKCLENKKMYIGSSVNIITRIECHRSELRGCYHGNCKLQRAFNKYGETSFIIGILEKVDNLEELLIREQHYIDIVKPEFNLCLDVKRHSFSEESKKKLSESRKLLFSEGKLKSPIARAVKKYDLFGNFITEYDSISAAAKKNNIHITSVERCVYRKTKQCRGFIWRYSTEKEIPLMTNKKGIFVKLIDTVNDNEILFTSIHKCASYLNTHDSCLYAALNKGSLYKRRYALYKLGEFREKPEVVNPELSLRLNGV